MILPSQTKPHIRTGAARVLRKPYAAVVQKLSGLDPANRILDRLAELLSLLLGDGGSEASVGEQRGASVEVALASLLLRFVDQGFPRFRRGYHERQRVYRRRNESPLLVKVFCTL